MIPRPGPWTALGFLLLAAGGRGQPPTAAGELRTAFLGPGAEEWRHGMRVELRLEEHATRLQLFLGEHGWCRLQTELTGKRVWDVIGPEGPWRCQPREAWPLQGPSLRRLERLRAGIGLLTLWSLEGAGERAAEGLRFRRAGGGEIEVLLDGEGLPGRLELRPDSGPALRVEVVPRAGRHQGPGPRWPRRLRLLEPGGSESMEVHLDRLLPLQIMEKTFFAPDSGARVDRRLLPEGLEPGRILRQRLQPERALVLPAPASALDRDRLLLETGRWLTQSGFTLGRLPALRAGETGWQLLVPFAGAGSVPPEAREEELPGGSYALLVVVGPWSEEVLKAVPRLGEELRGRGLHPAGLLQITPFRRPGQLLLPFEEGEQLTELRVLVEAGSN